MAKNIIVIVQDQVLKVSNFTDYQYDLILSANGKCIGRSSHNDGVDLVLEICSTFYKGNLTIEEITKEGVKILEDAVFVVVDSS